MTIAAWMNALVSMTIPGTTTQYVGLPDSLRRQDLPAQIVELPTWETDPRYPRNCTETDTNMAITANVIIAFDELEEGYPDTQRATGLQLADNAKTTIDALDIYEGIRQAGRFANMPIGDRYYRSIVIQTRIGSI